MRAAEAVHLLFSKSSGTTVRGALLLLAAHGLLGRPALRTLHTDGRLASALAFFAALFLWARPQLLTVAQRMQLAAAMRRFYHARRRGAYLREHSIAFKESCKQPWVCRTPSKDSIHLLPAVSED